MMQHRLLMVAAATLITGAAWAQYKVVGPDGKITYTDTPPPTGKAQPVGRPAGEGADTENLPYELRQVVGRYPVTLYTTGSCGACDAARSLLRQRGVPFTERTVNTSADAALLVQNEGSTDLPVARLGGQQLKGFNSADWNGYLDAAGYPKQSQLPSSYKFRDPTPLAPLTVRPAPTPAPATANPPPPTPAPAAPPSTPGGIKF
jgi:glutaredoxin